MKQKTFKRGSYEFEIAVAMLAWPSIHPSREHVILFNLLGAGWGSRIAWNKKGQLQHWDEGGLERENPIRKWLVGKTQENFEKELLKIRRQQVAKKIYRHRAYCKKRIESYREIYIDGSNDEKGRETFERRCKFIKEETVELIKEDRRMDIIAQKPTTIYIWDNCPAMVFPPDIRPDWVDGIHEAIRIAESLPGDKPDVTKMNKTNLEKIKANLKKAGLLKEEIVSVA